MGDTWFIYEWMAWHVDMLLRLFLAFLAGGVVGLEREFHGRPAGLRTHILVSLGAAVVCLISKELAPLSGALDEASMIRVDPGRIAAGVVTGIGFLGAGAIIKSGFTTRGLTTAASIWCMATVGMCLGFGLFALAAFAVILMLFTLVVLDLVERHLARRWYKLVRLELSGPIEQAEQLIEQLTDQGWHVVDFGMRHDKEHQSTEVKLDVRLKNKADVPRLARALGRMDQVGSFSMALRFEGM